MATDRKHIVTGKARLSYVNVFNPKPGKDGGEAKYSSTILIPKTDFPTRQRIDGAINAAIQEGISKLWAGVKPQILAIPIYDGDGGRPSDGQQYGDECKGHWVFTASSKFRPQIVDLGGNPIIGESEIYSGVYAHVGLDFFPYNNQKKGVGCSLSSIIKIEDGEPLGGRTSVNEDLAALTGQQYAAAPAPTQPAYNPAPAPVAPNYGYPAYPPQAAPVDPITGLPITG